MPSLDARLTALADALQRRQMEQLAPVDPLSASLFDLQRELAALDAEGKAELLAELNQSGDNGRMGLDLDMEGLEQWIKAFCDG